MGQLNRNPQRGDRVQCMVVTVWYPSGAGRMGSDEMLRLDAPLRDPRTLFPGCESVESSADDVVTVAYDPHYVHG